MQLSAVRFGRFRSLGGRGGGRRKLRRKFSASLSASLPAASSGRCRRPTGLPRLTLDRTAIPCDAALLPVALPAGGGGGRGAIIGCRGGGAALPLFLSSATRRSNALSNCLGRRLSSGGLGPCPRVCVPGAACATGLPSCCPERLADSMICACSIASIRSACSSRRIVNGRSSIPCALWAVRRPRDTTIVASTCLARLHSRLAASAAWYLMFPRSLSASAIVPASSIQSITRPSRVDFVHRCVDAHPVHM